MSEAATMVWLMQWDSLYVFLDLSAFPLFAIVPNKSSSSSSSALT